LTRENLHEEKKVKSASISIGIKSDWNQFLPVISQTGLIQVGLNRAKGKNMIQKSKRAK